MTDEILTVRLQLIEATRELLLAERDAPQTLAALLDARADATWEPLPAFVLEIMLERADETDPNGRRWPAFYVIERAERLLIGGVGFKGLPRDGSIEIGYGLASAQWNRGYASEAVAALCERAFARGVARIYADVDEANLASARVLRRNGFERAGSTDKDEIRFVNKREKHESVKIALV